MKTKVLSLTLLSVLLFGCKKTITIDDITSPEALHNRAVGASANELLRNDKYTSLVIEVQYMPGFAPDAAALNHVQNFLSSYVNKTAGITIVTKEINASSTAAFTTSDIVSIEKNNRSVFSSGNQISIYILYTNGQFSDSRVLGIAYRNTSAAVSGKNIKSFVHD